MKLEYVYLISADNNQYKIGRTKNLSKRLKQIRTACPNAKIEHYWEVEDSHSWEKRLHHMLFQFKIHPRHEWFQFSEEEKEIIKRLTP